MTINDMRCELEQLASELEDLEIDELQDIILFLEAR